MAYSTDSSLEFVFELGSSDFLVFLGDEAYKV